MYKHEYTRTMYSVLPIKPCDMLYMYIVHKVDRIEVSEAWDRYI